MGSLCLPLWRSAALHSPLRMPSCYGQERCLSNEATKGATCRRRIHLRCENCQTVIMKYLANDHERPEAMGLICALVYLLAIINFLPFAFKRDIVEVTSGAGNKDRVLEAQDIENGRFLHRFPLERVRLHLISILLVPMLMHHSLLLMALRTARWLPSLSWAS